MTALFTESLKPIYHQIAEWLEAEILSGNIGAHEKVFSQYQLAQMFNINPATAAKGINILADEAILYKKRGLGMFVSPEACQLIRRRRRQHTLKELAVQLVQEARRLGVSAAELNRLVKELQEKGEN